MDNLIPEPPQWFADYLQSLTRAQKNELGDWLNAEDGGDAVLDTLTEKLS
jgi:hypothetical protein